MKPTLLRSLTASALLFGLCLALSGLRTQPAVALAAQPAADGSLKLDLRNRVANPADPEKFEVKQTAASWDPHKTAVVICDMWDHHWCKSATARVGEMAPRMNEVIGKLRERGVLVVWCPSSTMDFYKDFPGRKMTQSAPPAPPQKRLTAAIPEGPFPIDQSDGGCPDDPPCPQGSPWRRQVDLLEIKPVDGITDSNEAYNLMRQRGIENVLVMGVHTNMCILERPFAIKSLVRQGMNVVLMRDLTDTMYNPKKSPKVDHFTGTDLVVQWIEKYWCPTVTSDQVLGGKPFRFAADHRTLTGAAAEREQTIRVPSSDGQSQRVKSYVETQPEPSYRHASEDAFEAFRDIKYGVRIHWGIYSIDAHGGESWPFLNMPFDKRQSYQELYKTWNPQGFNADEWMKLFADNGMKMFAFTSKHHEGFSMFDTKTRVKQRINWTAEGGPKIEDCDLAYSIMETPFHRDVVKELCDSAHKHNMKIDLYFSHPDWYDADFRPYCFHPATTPANEANPGRFGNAKPRGAQMSAPDVTPAETERMIARHRQQLKELLTNYGKIDMVCLDMWMGPDVWPALRETVSELRKIQPDVMLRARGIGNYGDYYTPEGFVPGSKENTEMPWFVIYPLAGSFSYVADPHRYKGGDWIVNNLVDTVAKGGNFMVGIGPDRDGKFHPKAVEALKLAGAWLKVNGEAIYETRARAGDLWKDGANIRFTRTKDSSRVYAICLKWPGATLQTKLVTPKPGSTIRLLGVDKDLTWRHDDKDGLTVEIPEAIAKQVSGQPAFAFRIEVTAPAVATQAKSPAGVAAK